MKHKQVIDMDATFENWPNIVNDIDGLDIGEFELDEIELDLQELEFEELEFGELPNIDLSFIID